MKGYKLNFPARDWCEGTLCGNGTMGAIMMGGTCEERIILNREDLFAPLYDRETPIPMAEKLSEIRKLIGEGKYEEAGSVPWKIFLEHHNMY